MHTDCGMQEEMTELDDIGVYTFQTHAVILTAIRCTCKSAGKSNNYNNDRAGSVQHRRKSSRCTGNRLVQLTTIT